MKICIYIDIDNTEYEKYHIKDYLINSVKHILTDIKSKAIFIEKPIVYKDEYSNQYTIKEDD